MDTSQSLLPAASEFLTEAIRNHRSRRSTFAILHAVTAVELVLKERLRVIHPNLIFENIDNKNGRTVGLRNLPKRLLNLGIAIEPEHKAEIETFADWRNEIVHHLPAFDKAVAASQLPQLLDFVASFLRRELDTGLKDVLPIELYSHAERLLDEWAPTVAEARNRASKGPIAKLSCPRCAVFGVLSGKGENVFRCELCGAEGFTLHTCDECGRETVLTTSPYPGDHYCDECIERAGDMYHDHQDEMMRGR